MFRKILFPLIFVFTSFLFVSCTESELEDIQPTDLNQPSNTIVDDLNGLIR